MSNTGGEDPPKPPERVGPYRIESRLGIGGMGAVYRAYDTRLERPVAIKNILPEAAEDTKARERLRREARAVASLNHPAIVQIFDIVEEDAGDWIVMELVEGQTLHQQLSRGKLELGRAVDLGRQVAEGLAEAHGKGIVHRDLKTENVMVTLTNRAKILDFGLAKRMFKGRADVSLSVQGSILGTSRSMSPEQAMGDPIDHRSDLFSLGSLIYEITVGRPPFIGSSIFHTLAQVCSDRQRPAQEINPRIPEALSELIDRLLEKNPAHRPQSATEVAEALRKISSRLRREGGSAVISTPPAASDPSASTAVRPGLRRAEASGTGERTRSVSTGAYAGSQGIFIKTLLRFSLVEEKLGGLDDDRRFEVRTLHSRRVRDLLAQSDGMEVDKNDGFLLLFDRPADAVRFALIHQVNLQDLGREVGLELEARAGIHLGEVFLRENSQEDMTWGAKLFELEGSTRQVTLEVEQIARPGQILVTQSAFELARRVLAGERVEGGDLHWETHGTFEIAGLEEPLSLCEVGLEGYSDFRSPESSTTRILEPVVASAGKKRLGPPWLLPVAGLLALLLTLGFFSNVYQQSAKGPESTPEQAPRRSVAVLDLHSLKPAPESSWIGSGFAESLSTELAVGEQLRLIPRESVVRMARDLELEGFASLDRQTLDKVGEYLDVEYVVTGSFFAGGGAEERLTVNLWLQPTVTKEGSRATTLSEQGQESELLNLVEILASELRLALEVEGLTMEQTQQAETAIGMGTEAMRKYSEGLELLRSYQARDARELLQQAVELEPQNALAHAALSDAWRAVGEDVRALESAERAYELRSGLPRINALEIEGRYYETASRLEEAIKSYGALYLFFPESIDYGLRVARLESASGDGQEALRTLEELRRLDPEDARIDLVEAEVTYDLFNFQRSLEAGRRAEEKASRNDASTLLAEAYGWQGNALMQLGDSKRAQEVLIEAENRFFETGNLGSTAEAMITRATVLQYAGKVDRAEALYLEALATLEQIGNRTEVVTVQNNLALLYKLRGRLKDARALLEQTLEQALELGDRNEEARVLDSLVWVVMHQGKLDEARQLAQQEQAIYRALDVSDGLGWSEFYLGKVELAAGDTVGARRHLEAGLGYLDASLDYQEAFLRHALAEVLLAKGEEPAARLALDRAFELRQELDEKVVLADTRLLLALALDREGKREQALEAARTAGEEYTDAASPDFEALAFAHVAEFYLDGDDLSAARTALERARRAAPESEYPVVRAHLERVEALLQASEGDAQGALARLADLATDLESRGFVLLAFEIRGERLRLALRADLAKPGEVGQFLVEVEQRGLSGVAWGLVAD